MKFYILRQIKCYSVKLKVFLFGQVVLYCSSYSHCLHSLRINITNVLRGGAAVAVGRWTDRSRVQFPAGPLSLNIGQLSLASLRGH